VMKIKNKEISKSVLLTRARHQQLRVYAAMQGETYGKEKVYGLFDME